jgi:hypothetical protein
MPPAGRPELLLGGAALLAARPAVAQPATDYAVFTVFSPDTKPMQPGWNRRAPETTTIRAPTAAGYCRLRTFDAAAREDSRDLHAIDNGDRSVICVGSVSSANMGPSLFEGVFATARTAQVVLEHQSGTSPRQIYLRVLAQNSKWHAFARINIRRI